MSNDEKFISIIVSKRVLNSLGCLTRGGALPLATLLRTCLPNEDEFIFNQRPIDAQKDFIIPMYNYVILPDLDMRYKFISERRN